MIRTKIHLISSGCPQLSLALTVQNRGLKHHSFHFSNYAVQSNSLKQCPFHLGIVSWFGVLYHLVVSWVWHLFSINKVLKFDKHNSKKNSSNWYHVETMQVTSYFTLMPKIAHFQGTVFMVFVDYYVWVHDVCRTRNISWESGCHESENTNLSTLLMRCHRN